MAGTCFLSLSLSLSGRLSQRRLRACVRGASAGAGATVCFRARSALCQTLSLQAGTRSLSFSWHTSLSLSLANKTTRSNSNLRERSQQPNSPTRCALSKTPRQDQPTLSHTWPRSQSMTKTQMDASFLCRHSSGSGDNTGQCRRRNVRSTGRCIS